MELYAIKYGQNFTYATEETIYRGMRDSKKVPEFIFLYYLAKYNDRIILFDTGFRDKIFAANMGITLIDIENEVKNILDSRGCVDIVFITHSHFDHIDNLDLYDKSAVIISKLEYDIAINQSPDPVKRRLKTNNVITTRDEYIYDNKFRFKVIGGHTAGSSVIYFEEEGKQYVITGDECYSCDNILKNIPIGFYADSQKNENFITDAYTSGLIPLPYHDAKIITNYQHISENIVRII